MTINRFDNFQSLIQNANDLRGDLNKMLAHYAALAWTSVHMVNCRVQPISIESDATGRITQYLIYLQEFVNKFSVNKMYVLKNTDWAGAMYSNVCINLNNYNPDVGGKVSYRSIIVFFLSPIVMPSRNISCCPHGRNRANRLNPSRSLAAVCYEPEEWIDLQGDYQNDKNCESDCPTQPKAPVHLHLRYRGRLKPISLTPGCTGRAWA